MHHAVIYVEGRSPPSAEHVQAYLIRICGTEIVVAQRQKRKNSW